MENFAKFVSSRGLLKSCSCHNVKPESSSEYIDINILDNLPPGGSIYICTDALINFSSNFISKINSPFVLVTGDSDLTLDDKLLSNPCLQKILNNPYLLKWFAQNLAASHHKLIHLPIGIDYHTMNEKPGLWSLSKTSPLSQELVLLDILKSSKSLENRYLMAYCNWQFTLDRGDRQLCYSEVDKSCCYFERSSIPRHSTWSRQKAFMFVLSPMGVGVDCHRTWEALMLGCIPLVTESSIDSLFDDLPVIKIGDWSEVNSANLINYFNIINNNKYDFSSLFLNFWLDRINCRNVKQMNLMSIQEFKISLTHFDG